jgi:hypothetical protein
MDESVSLFGLTNFPFDLYLHKHHMFLAPFSSENQKSCRILNLISTPAFFKLLVSIAVGQELEHWHMSKFPKRQEHIQKSRVMEAVSIRFLLTE